MVKLGTVRKGLTLIPQVDSSALVGGQGYIPRSATPAGRVTQVPTIGSGSLFDVNSGGFGSGAPLPLPPLNPGSFPTINSAGLLDRGRRGRR